VGPSNNNFSTIITHYDLDGVASAALCSYIFDINNIVFTGPSMVDRETIEETTIVCDLPYTRPCGLWFDHHIANADELLLRNIVHQSLPGRLEEKHSCLHVIYDYFKADYDIEAWLPFVRAVNIVDGFLYGSVAEWRTQGPVDIIDASIKYDFSDRDYLHALVMMLRDSPFTAVAEDNRVRERAQNYKNSESSQLELIGKSLSFLDDKKEVILIDLTEHHNPPQLQKNLAFILYPNAKAVAELRCRYENGIKTNSLMLSLSLGFVNKEVKARVDLGEIMRTLNIGNGHPGSAGGQIICATKEERVQAIQKCVQMIHDLWKQQNIRRRTHE
jgi:oligoribonuclease NrnB/cAMP/cGMP phosphodiesterase (DHH superfamily)